MQKPAVGTQRIGASAKQAAQKVQKAAPKALGGTKRVLSPNQAQSPDRRRNWGSSACSAPRLVKHSACLPGFLLH